MPPQQTTTGPTPIERIERMNTVVVREQRQEMRTLRRDSYMMEMDSGRNCYTCGGFEHMAHHYRNRGRGRVVEGRRVEYGRGRIKGNIEQIRYLKEMENLEFLD